MATTAKKGMTKTALIKHLAETVGVNKKEAAKFLEVLAETGYKEAKRGFTLPGIGKLVVVKRKARMGRNPATGEPVKIKASKKLAFRQSAAMKQAVAR